MLVESLFGATFRSVPMAPGEAWHPDVLKMLLQHPEEVHAWMINTIFTADISMSHIMLSVYPWFSEVGLKYGLTFVSPKFDIVGK